MRVLINKSELFSFLLPYEVWEVCFEAVANEKPQQIANQNNAEYLHNMKIEVAKLLIGLVWHHTVQK